MIIINSGKYIVLLLCMLCLLLASCSESVAPIYQGPEVQFLETNQTKDLEDQFARYSYRLDALEQGVPPLILQAMPNDLEHLNSNKKKKRIFFKTMLPMILLANQEIKQERKTLKVIKQQIGRGMKLAQDQRRKLTDIANRYEVKLASLTSPQAIDELLNRVDIVPPELALAQAANESAWGTSRFSKLANNLFGEWTFTPGTGIIPEDRPEGATYEVRRFESVFDSVRSYLLNLNTHYAYKEFRQLRAEFRATDQPLNGIKLAEGLFRYSIRGEEYVKDLQALIRANRLERFSLANLRLRS